MRRTKEDDTLRAISVKIYGKKKHRTVILPKSAEPGLTTKVVTRCVKVSFFFYCWFLDLSCVVCFGFLNSSVP